ncbi:MAG: preprotein translocase subunit SecG [Rickettsiales bacterium]|jgi:preprotein translocase subunit SecG|nr:preprotein translocase subunit SecG [Rickettsiales bacterium]
MINVLLVLNIIVVIMLIGIILLQKSEGGVLGMGGGSRNAVFSAHAAGGMVTKITYTLGALFFIICMALAILIARRSDGSKSFVEMMAAREKADGARKIETPKTAAVPEDSMNEARPDANGTAAPIRLRPPAKKPAVPVN